MLMETRGKIDITSEDISRFDNNGYRYKGDKICEHGNLETFF